jgi:hypothetical protein
LFDSVAEEATPRTFAVGQFAVDQEDVNGKTAEIHRRGADGF